MQNSVELEKEIKQLRAQRDDLLRQLSQYENQLAQKSNSRSPLTDLSDFTHGIIHDVTNGLDVIGITVDGLEADLTDTAHLTALHKISRSVDFCLLVMRNLAALSGKESLQLQEVQLEPMIDEVFLLLESKLIEVELDKDIASDASTIEADAGQMRQVLMNLFKNAGEAMPDGGLLTVRTRPEGEMIRVQIQDTGHGISPENLQRLFKEFFTTKDRGFGLGLSIVYNIIEHHNGVIVAESEVNEGTTFTIRLPRKAKKSDKF